MQNIHAFDNKLPLMRAKKTHQGLRPKKKNCLFPVTVPKKIG